MLRNLSDLRMRRGCGLLLYQQRDFGDAERLVGKQRIREKRISHFCVTSIIQFVFTLYIYNKRRQSRFTLARHLALGSSPPPPFRHFSTIFLRRNATDARTDARTSQTDTDTELPATADEVWRGGVGGQLASSYGFYAWSHKIVE